VTVRLTGQTVAVLALTALVACGAPPERQAGQGPSGQLNVLVITVDDMNWNSVGVYGAAMPSLTPNIDRLAEDGVRFEYAHVTVAICQPARAAWMTGRYPHRSGALGFDPIRPGVPTLPETLRAVGYRTGVMAKHGHMLAERPDAWTVVVPARELKNGRSPDLYYERARQFMVEASTAGQPFFLVANSQDPHRPFAASAAEARQRLTDSASTEHQYGGGFPETELAFDPANVAVPGFLPDLPDVRRELAEYYTSARRADETTGAVLRALDESGLADRTLVMFLSDNGIDLPFAKTNVWLHSTRVPWIVRWPGVTSADTVDSTHVVSGIDLAPTILEAVGAPPLAGADGRSFIGLLRGEREDGWDYAFTHMNTTVAPAWFGMRSVVGRRYGYIYNAWADGEREYFNNAMRGLTFPAMRAAAATDPGIATRVRHLLHRSKEEFYDYSTDPDALVNLVHDDEFADAVARHRALLLEHMRATGDPELAGYEALLASSP